MNSETVGNAGMYDFLGWIEVNRNKIATALVIAVAVGFVFFFMRHRKNVKEAEASTQLLALRPALNAGTNAVPVSASAYQKVAEEFAGTRAAERALLLAATALFTESKYAEAQAAFEKMLKQNPNSIWAPQAAYGVATSIEAQGKQDQALQEYRNIVSRYPNSGVIGDTRLALARIYESKKQPELALTEYDQLTRGSDAFGGGEVMTLRQNLLKNYPHLAKTNVPTASMPGTNVMTRPATATNSAPSK
ncbi:MAG: tetratricopeptide repeat protein [Verrucomicrobiota bacterium]|nr:tetratricopeptide repeat protein [Verrucomicrobiota bacterium]